MRTTVLQSILTICVLLGWSSPSKAETLLDSLPTHCDSFTYFLRLQSNKTKAYDVAIEFGDGSRIEVRVPSVADAADNYGQNTKYAYLSADRTRTERKAAVEIDPSEKGFGVKLSATASGLMIAVGGHSQQGELSVKEFNPRRAHFIRAIFPDGIRVLRHDLHADSVSAPEFSRFDSPEALYAYLDASTNPREGIYAYLDKNIPTTSPAAISQPEEFKFAIVADESYPGALTLLFLEGSSDEWQPLEIKARLCPTAFIGHFDLEWIDDRHRHIAGDTYAQFNENSSILTLNFPLLDASFRLSRKPLF